MDKRSMTRRAALASLVTGGAATLSGTFGLSSAMANRDVSVAVADGANALVGVVGQGPVQKNQREAMVEYTNNTDTAATITTTLDSCSDGTLYDNEGGSGCAVSIEVAPGNARLVDISASVSGAVGYSISVSSQSFGLETSGTVEAQSGNVKGAVRIKKPSKDKDFTADTNRGIFSLKQVDIVDDQGPADLDRIEFRVREGGTSGTVVGQKDITNPPADQYRSKNEEVDPNQGYAIQSGRTYALTVTGYDAQGNFSSETVEDTT